MRLVIVHTILMGLWVGAVWAADPPSKPTHVSISIIDPTTNQEKIVEVPREQADQIISHRNRFTSAKNFFLDPILKEPVTPEKINAAKELAKRAVQPVSNDTQEEEARKFFTETTQKLVDKGVVKSDAVGPFVDNLVAISKENPDLKDFLGDRSRTLNEIVKLTRDAEEKQAVQKNDDTAKDPKDADRKAAEQLAQKEKERQAQEFQKQLEQQALAQALNQAGNGGGNGKGGGQGGSGNSPSSNSKPPESPKFDNNQPKHDNLADQLSKALNQNNNNANLNSLFGNNNNSSSSSSNKEKKEDGFKFDISPKTPQNKVEPVKASAPTTDTNSPLDPSAANPQNAAISNVLSGPTSVPQVISGSAQNPFNPAGDMDGGGAAGGGFSGGIKGGNNIGGGDNGSASDIFSSVGRVDYGDLPPPIRKDSAAFGGEGGEGGGGGENYGPGGSASTFKKANSLLDELTLMSDNPRAKGRGIMAFVGVQIKDVCSKSSSKKMGVCVIRKLKQEQISLNNP